MATPNKQMLKLIKKINASKINDIITTDDNIKLKIINNSYCDDCYFKHMYFCHLIKCASYKRQDKKTIAIIKIN